jgi:hypothetical protein
VRLVDISSLYWEIAKKLQCWDHENVPHFWEVFTSVVTTREGLTSGELLTLGFPIVWECANGDWGSHLHFCT